MPYNLADTDERLIDALIQTDLGIAALGDSGQWEVIIKYNGDISPLERDLNARVELLGGNYAIVTLNRNDVGALFEQPQIQYIELPRLLAAQLNVNANSACITTVTGAQGSYGLSGRGTLVAVIDSGIDARHPDFTHADGTTRILYVWDQSATGGAPPRGFYSGVEYTARDINRALLTGTAMPVTDPLGHGTAIAGIAAGNGRASGGENTGVAPEASLIVVRLEQRGGGNFTRTTELMRAIRYVMDKAAALNMPVAINISYGTNNGAHDGNSLFETYINDMADEWKTVIVVGTGNEGRAGHHYSAVLATGETDAVAFSINAGVNALYVSLWKDFADTFNFELISPSGASTGLIPFDSRDHALRLENTLAFILVGRPTNYNVDQEVYFLLQQESGTLPTGVWTLRVSGVQVVDGRFNVWLPTVEDVTDRVAFLNPATVTTLTLPSTALRVLSVGGYNAMLNTAIAYSGRGYTRNDIYVKPDLVAPAYDILTTLAGGGYSRVEGTSFAAPFVTGSAALMMEWGIVRGHDPFLYGQKVKAYLRRGARRQQPLSYPNPIWGYGTLCLRDTMDALARFESTDSQSISAEE